MESKTLKKARVMTRPKANTLDPQGVVVKSNLERSLGIKYLKKVSIGRYIEVELEEGPEEEVKKNIQEAIDKILYNEIIEDYEVIYE
jgi:phosphoribosylformylglycinamidine synthase PurS subunit|tara:strand:- start:2906 stop:3166 length:261 start_codon:yes stop_codon:yes gene_type:complete